MLAAGPAFHCLGTRRADVSGREPAEVTGRACDTPVRPHSNLANRHDYHAVGFTSSMSPMKRPNDRSPSAPAAMATAKRVPLCAFVKTQSVFPIHADIRVVTLPPT